MLIFSKRQPLLSFFHYMNYFLIIFVFAFFKYHLIQILKVNVVVLIIMLLFEIILRTLWAIFNIIEFKHVFLMNLIQKIVAWVILYSLSDEQSKKRFLVYSLLCYTLFLTVVDIIYFIVEKKDKTAFYYMSLLKYESNSFKDIYEQTKIGFLSIKEKKIVMMNSMSKIFVSKLPMELDQSELYIKNKHKYRYSS
jgi:hypothetical protein